MNACISVHSKDRVNRQAASSGVIGMVLEAIKVRVFALFHTQSSADAVMAQELRHLANLQGKCNESYASDLLAAARQCEQYAKEQSPADHEDRVVEVA